MNSWSTETFEQVAAGAAAPRRLRLSPALRRMVRQIDLRPDHLICPLFVSCQSDAREPIASMAGQYRFSVDGLVEEARQVRDLGIPAVMLFGIPDEKDESGSGAWVSDGVIQQAVRALRERVPELVVITDVCLCEYTVHGHCGIVNRPGDPQGSPHLPAGYVLNGPTLEILQRIAVSQAAAGADIVAPSGMIDGMVGAIRQSLDGEGYAHIPIMSYSVKYASAFYGPFRDAAGGAPAFGDRRTHQMDPANISQILVESRLDAAEGADFLMVKPALAYLDVISKVRQAFPELPLVAYSVSGEYAMIKAAARDGLLDERAAVMELLLGIRRAGADLVISYHAKDVCKWLNP